MATRLNRKKRRLNRVMNKSKRGSGNQIFLISDPIFIVSLSLSDDFQFLRFNSLQLTTKGASYKIDFTSLSRFVDDLCKKFYLASKEGFDINFKDLSIDLHKSYFAAETIRDIYTGEISQLLADNSETTSNTVSSFGFKWRFQASKLKYAQLC